MIKDQSTLEFIDDGESGACNPVLNAQTAGNSLDQCGFSRSEVAMNRSNIAGF